MTPTFAAALDDLLTSSGLSNNQLARKLHMDPAQVGRWRRARGLPKPENVARIAVAFNVRPEWLLGLAYPQYSPTPPEPDDPLEAAIRSRTAELRAVLDGVPPAFWPTIVRKIFDRAIGEARDALALGRQLDAQQPVSVAQEPRISAPPGTPTRPKRGNDGALVIRKQPALPSAA